MTWQVRTLKDAHNRTKDNVQDEYERGYRKGYWEGIYQAVELLKLGATPRQLEYWSWNELNTWRYKTSGFEPAPIPETWKAIRKRILERDKYTCHYCGDKATQVDHVIPVSRDGTYEDDNLVAACQPCNFSKGTKTLNEWDGHNP